MSCLIYLFIAETSITETALGPHVAQSKVLYGPVYVFAIAKVTYIPGLAKPRLACGSLPGFMRLLRKYCIYSCLSRRIFYKLFGLKVGVWLVHEMRPAHTLLGAGQIQGAIAHSPPLKPTKVTLFTMVLYNSEINISKTIPSQSLVMFELFIM